MAMNGFSDFPLFMKKMMFLYLNSYKSVKAKNKFSFPRLFGLSEFLLNVTLIIIRKIICFENHKSEKCKRSKVVKIILLTL